MSRAEPDSLEADSNDYDKHVATSSASSSAPSRRQEYAAATHAAIIQAARELFAQHGFIATKVEDIAARARVAPATVYTSVGGKHALLTILMEQLATWQPRTATFDRIAQARTSLEVLSALAHGTRNTHEQWDDVQRVITETAPHDKAAAAVQAERIKRYRAALGTVVNRLKTLEGPTFDSERAEAILWFYFGPNAYRPLHDDLGWSYAETETWLLARCEQALGLR
jgi:AcrR family transcriptional regulator